ncbi:hypothetical protein J1614_004302 [Plenodomus biglobosus]|nr:hypothetical protein J1614_004302 [Plenodomus biglobosus]
MFGPCLDWIVNNSDANGTFFSCIKKDFFFAGMSFVNNGFIGSMSWKASLRKYHGQSRRKMNSMAKGLNQPSLDAWVNSLAVLASVGLEKGFDFQQDVP